jgi:hypothetical protein
MEDAINEAMFEFALTVQQLVKHGWTFSNVTCGERRLGIGPSVTLSKMYGNDLREEKCYCLSDIERIVDRENKSAAATECHRLMRKYKETNDEADKKAFWDCYWRSGLGEGNGAGFDLDVKGMK